MTRCRAGEGHVPTPLNAVYYEQRASAGLIVSEATQVSPLGVGYPNTPGIYSTEQVAGWKKITDGVHRAGGRIFLQLWHVGRVSHSLWLNGERPVSSSAVAVRGELYTPGGMKPYDTPRALELSEIPVAHVVFLFLLGAVPKPSGHGEVTGGCRDLVPGGGIEPPTSNRSGDYGDFERDILRPEGHVSLAQGPRRCPPQVF
jgi:hypothetical protein